MTVRPYSLLARLLVMTVFVAACSKDNQETTEPTAKKNLLLSEDHLAPVFKKNDVPADLQDSYIVVFNDDVPESEIDGESTRMCGSAKSSKEHTYKYAVKGFSTRLTATAIEEFRRNPKVKYIEQNQEVSIVATQNGATWGLDRVDQDNLPLSTTYTYSTNGSTVTAYIFDTGVRTLHNEFGTRVIQGFSAVSTEATTEDGNGHGTHVAGTVGGTVYGIAKGVTIVPVKVLSATGSGTNAGVIAGLDWAVNHHATGVKAVGNMSLGGGASTALDDAVIRCITDGIVMVVAAGNSNVDAISSSPARVAQAITVGATTNTDARSSFSNYGSVVDIFAPGSSITSAWFTSNTALNTISGTSMASPHVAGAAALYLEYASTSTPSQVEAGLKQFGAVGRLSGIPAGTTNNLLQINFGTIPPLPAPGVPTLSSPAANATNVSIAPTLSWLASTAASTYNLQVSVSSNLDAGPYVVNLTGLTATSRALSGLSNSTVYYWRVSATNSVGTSAWSATRSFTTVAPPGTPTAPTLSSPANNATNVSRTATFSWGSATNAATYEIEISTVNTFATTVFTRTGLTTRSVAVTPAMPALTTHYWRVRARNSLGVVGPWSAVRTFRTR